MRIIAAGSQALMDGFSLLGVETYADIDHEQLDQLLNEITHSKERTLLYLQQDLAQSNSPTVQRIRKEGGSILISELPHLHQPNNRTASIDTLLNRVMGTTTLERADGHNQ